MQEPVYLRALEQRDIEKTYKWHNSPELYRTIVGPYFFVSREAERLWLDKQCKYSDKEINLAICEVESDEHIGNIYLRSIDWIARTGALNVFIGEVEKQSHGYGDSAVRQLIDYAFRTLNLRKIYLRVLSDNLNAIKLYKKLGFIVEGELKSHVYKNGKYRNVLMMGLTMADPSVNNLP